MTKAAMEKGAIPAGIVGTLVLKPVARNNGLYDPDWLWDHDVIIPVYTSIMVLAVASFVYLGHDHRTPYFALAMVPIAVGVALHVIGYVRRRRDRRGEQCSAPLWLPDDRSATELEEQPRLYCEGDAIELDQLVRTVCQPSRDVRLLSCPLRAYLLFLQVALLCVTLPQFVGANRVTWAAVCTIPIIALLALLNCALWARVFEVADGELRVRPCGLVNLWITRERAYPLSNVRLNCSYPSATLRIAASEGDSVTIHLGSVARRHELVGAVYRVALGNQSQDVGARCQE